MKINGKSPVTALMTAQVQVMKEASPGFSTTFCLELDVEVCHCQCCQGGRGALVNRAYVTFREVKYAPSSHLRLTLAV